MLTTPGPPDHHMELILGTVTQKQLPLLWEEAIAACESVDIAVAYASSADLIIPLCKKHQRPLRFFGRLDSTLPVSLEFLTALLALGAKNARAYLARDSFHAKVVWWRSYGVYIGSANLTARSWTSNIEAGVFVRESAMTDSMKQALEDMLAKLEASSLPVSQQLIEGLHELVARRADVDVYDDDGPFRDLFDAGVAPSVVTSTTHCEIKVTFYAHSGEQDQRMLRVVGDYDDDVRALLHPSSSIEGVHVKWIGGAFDAGTFAWYDDPGEWKLTVSSRKQEAAPLYDFAGRHLGTKKHFDAVLSRDGSAVTIELGIDLTPEAPYIPRDHVLRRKRGR